MSIQEILIEWRGVRETPSFANLGDILKGMQTILNLIVGSRVSLRITEINTIQHNQFSIQTEVNLPDGEIEDAINRLRQTWDSFNSDNIIQVLELINVPRAAIQIIQDNSLEPENLSKNNYQESHMGAIEQLGHAYLEFERIPTKLEHISRAKTWHIQ